MQSGAVNHGIMCSSCRFPLQVHFAYFIWPDLASLPWNISVRYSHQVAQLPSENSHGFASEALSLLFVVEGWPNNQPFTETWRRRQGMGFSTYFCQVSDRSEHGRLSLTWNSCRFAGNWRFPRTTMAQWQNSLNFQSFLHRSCLRVECHVVSVSFVSLRNCGAWPLVAPANHDSGHRAIRCCIFEDGDDVDRKEVKQRAAFSF